MRRMMFCMLITIGASLLLLVECPATTYTWKAATTGDWFTAGNWTNESGYPSDGDTVIITNEGSYVILSNTTARLAELTLGGNTAGQRTLSFTNWDTCLYATNMTVMINGYVTCEGPFTNNAMSNRVNLACASKLNIEGGGAINVNGKGYSGNTNTAWTVGDGPGGGAGGGSHGGVGQVVYNGAYLGDQKTNGSPTAPVFPGSGGCSGHQAAPGGHGGGAVCITAAQVVVSSSISADGLSGTAAHGSGGSGGSVFITCSTITGTNGTITAKGGDCNSLGGGGGGGRIAVLYDQTAQANEPVPSIQFSALSGLGNSLKTMPDIGTLYFPDNYFFSPTNLFNGQWLAPGFTNLSLANWTVSNVWIRLPGAGFRLTVTNTLTVASTDYATGYKRNKLELANAAAVSCGQCLLNGGTLGLTWPLVIYYSSDVLNTDKGVITGVTLNCLGNLTLTNSGRLNVSSGLTNPDVPSAKYGAWVKVGGDIRIATNSWLCPVAHPTNGTAVLLSMRNLTIDRGGGINADSLGYACGVYDGSTLTNVAYGPGAPPYGGGYGYRSGAGYGGVGGDYGGYYGTNYGSANAPVDPGSGSRAGYYWNLAPGTPGGGWGGGSVQIRADNTVLIQGTISANGGIGGAAYGGGASGGGIYITCRTFIGDSNATLQANGGAADIIYGAPYGGGGGGRIAVWRISDNSSSAISKYVNGGSGAVGTYGSNGTIVVDWLPPSGTIIRVR